MASTNGARGEEEGDRKKFCSFKSPVLIMRHLCRIPLSVTFFDRKVAPPSPLRRASSAYPPALYEEQNFFQVTSGAVLCLHHNRMRAKSPNNSMPFCPKSENSNRYCVRRLLAGLKTQSKTMMVRITVRCSIASLHINNLNKIPALGFERQGQKEMLKKLRPFFHALHGS